MMLVMGAEKKGSELIDVGMEPEKVTIQRASAVYLQSKKTTRLMSIDARSA